MRFTDPLITLWHMGGSIPTHIGMAMYSFSAYYYIKGELSHITDEKCMELYPKIDISDISYMSDVHIVSIVMILSRNFIFRIIFKDMDYLR